MPGIIQLGGQPYLLSWDTRVFDTLSDFMLVPIGEGGIDVSVAFLESDLDGVTNFVGFALPGAKADGWYLIARIESEGFARWGLGLAWDVNVSKQCVCIYLHGELDLRGYV